MQTVGLSFGGAGDIGSSLGYCLSQIRKYESAGKFFKDFGKQTALNGSINL